MVQRYYRISAKILAVFCLFVSLSSQSFHFVAMISLGIAAFLYCIGYAEGLEYDRERAYPILSFQQKAESFCNLGWAGLILLSVYLINQFWLAPVKTHLSAIFLLG